MPRVVHEENVKVYWLTSCANIQAPTVAEITAGKYLGYFITKDGVALNPNQDGVDTGGIETKFKSQIGGGWGLTPELTLFRDSGSETNGYDLIVPGTQGFLVRSPFGAPTVGKKVEVIPAEMGVPKSANSAPNEPQKFSVSYFATSEPALKAVVAS